ncbi:MBL fold metallo-hydrolase [Mycolicibacterium sp. 050158]|uniref:MBL fold metallo-hydrolase n=1 Tax=Mycolicibacterium sp. 050158 TaxID=3090602 RepID=UPI00299D17F7|nr:MBL fold metallo-hydrolase [Mycolicibacterium sp. 050158]MDX1888899.1 MBL fold metallo-hydrolase [Mycolicibacterium sp. 050158]
MSKHRLADDRDAPKADDLPPHVARIQLPLPLRDLQAVNVYAILGDDGVTLVDSGWADEPSETVLVDALGDLGFTPWDVKRIVVTHHHWDHYSRAIQWQRQYGTTVMIGHGERHSIEAFDEHDVVYPAQARLLVAAGAAELAQIIAKLPLDAVERDVPFGHPDAWVEDGQHIDCGGIDLVARSTPGHTRGHVVYEDRAAGLTFTGDHILPRITPSIALERAPEAFPLRSYLASLRLFLGLPDSSMLPSHGDVAASVKTRAKALLEHHGQRLDQARDLVAAGSSTAHEVARQMRWTRHERTVDELGPVHGMTAVLEMLAHLELLVTRGVLQRAQSSTINRYVVAANAV